MSMQFLPVFKSNASLEIDELLPQLSTASPRLEIILKLCQHFRIRGICALLLECATEQFLKDLHKSATAFLDFLRRADDSEKVLSRGVPIFDAIASGDLDCVREISRYSRLQWSSDEEFEDDYLYMEFIMRHFFLEGSVTECQSILDRLEDVGGGESGGRLEVCKAFISRNEELFEVALQEILVGHERRYSALRDTDALSPEEDATESKVCIEALALIKLAEGCHFELDQDYLFVPSMARRRTSSVYSLEDWKSS